MASQEGLEKMSQSSVACAEYGMKRAGIKAKTSAEPARDLILTFPP